MLLYLSLSLSLYIYIYIVCLPSLPSPLPLNPPKSGRYRQLPEQCVQQVASNGKFNFTIKDCMHAQHPSHSSFQQCCLHELQTCWTQLGSSPNYQASPLLNELLHCRVLSGSLEWGPGPTAIVHLMPATVTNMDPYGQYKSKMNSMEVSTYQYMCDQTCAVFLISNAGNTSIGTSL